MSGRHRQEWTGARVLVVLGGGTRDGSSGGRDSAGRAQREVGKARDVGFRVRDDDRRARWLCVRSQGSGDVQECRRERLTEAKRTWLNGFRCLLFFLSSAHAARCVQADVIGEERRRHMAKLVGHERACHRETTTIEQWRRYESTSATRVVRGTHIFM